jgi:dTDP-4-dehydrorhamnose reductase
MKVTVFGGDGMLGSDVVEACLGLGWEVGVVTLLDGDIRDAGFVRRVVEAGVVVVNCAAYTQVDRAEEERELAFAVNGVGAGHLAEACRERGCRLLHMSTDYVFSGTLGRAYREEDEPDPVNVYGASKLDGERRVLATGCESLIVRVQSLFGVRGPNFVKTICRVLAGENPALRVVTDQVSSPTYTRHLAGAIVALLAGGHSGIVHVRAAGECSWHAFAEAIAARVRPGAVVEPVTSVAYPRPARRPAHAVLDVGRFREWTGQELPSWQQGLEAYLKEVEA